MTLVVITRRGNKFDIKDFPRSTGHLSECLLVGLASLERWTWDNRWPPPDAHCTCDDWSPE